MFKNTVASIVCFGLILWSSLAYGQGDRIVYPYVEFGSQFPNSVEIELRLGNLSATDPWQGEIRLLRGMDLEGMDEVFIIDEDGYETLAEDGVFAVEIPADGAGVYCITSNPLQYGVLVVEATGSGIKDLNTSFAYKTRFGNLIADMDTVQPAAAPSRAFRGMVAGTDELDPPFANQESGFAVVSERALSGHPGTTELEFEVLLEGDETEHSGTITLGGSEPELQSLMLRDVIHSLPPSFKVGQLELNASGRVYLSMLGVGSPPVFKPRQVTSVPAQPFSKPVQGVGYLQYKDLLISFTEEFSFIWEDKGSRATLDGSFWQPVIPEDLDGFYAVGDLAIRGHGYDQKFPTRSSIALVKDDNGDYCAEDGEVGCSGTEKLTCNQHLRSTNGEWKTPALCPAVEWTKVWQHKPAAYNFYIWAPKPPEGYRCLGAIAGFHDESRGRFKPVDIYRCVRKDLLSPAVQGPADNDIWNASGGNWTPDDESFRASRIDPGPVPPGEAALAPGTFIASSDWLTALYHSGKMEFTSAPPPMALRLEIDQFIKEDPIPLPPLLESYDPPSPFSVPSDASTVTLPWFAVNDPGLHPIMQAIESPVYTMNRVTHYKLVEWSFNQTEVPQSVMWQFSWGTYGESAITMQHEVGITFGMEFGGEASPVKAKFELSYKFTHSRTDTSGWTTAKTFTLPVQIPPGTVVAAYQLESIYTLLRTDGTQISVDVPYALDRIIFSQYPQPADSEGMKGGRIILEGVLGQAE